MQSQAATVAEYLAELPAERRAALQQVRDVIRRNLAKDFEEGMLYGMIGYYVPHRIYPAGYHCDPSKPLGYIFLASQKNHLSLYAMCIYMSGQTEEEFRREWAQTGKKLDMGKSCIRFQKADDLPLELIGKLTRRFQPLEWVQHYESLRADYAKTKSARQSAPAVAKKKGVKSSPKKTAAAKKGGKKSVKKQTRKGAKQATRK